MPQICDMGLTALFPFRRLRLGLNPRTWVPEASTLTPRPPKPLTAVCTVCVFTRTVCVHMLVCVYCVCSHVLCVLCVCSRVLCVLCVFTCTVCTVCVHVYCVYCVCSHVLCVLCVFTCTVWTVCVHMYCVYCVCSHVLCVLCLFKCWSVNKNVLSFQSLNVKVTNPVVWIVQLSIGRR
jgi:hypothetical protein